MDPLSPPRAVLSWSSGKDCAFALQVCRRLGLARIEALFTTVDQASARVAMHGLRPSLLRAQATALGLPLIEVPLPWPCPNADYEAIMTDAVAALTARGITHMVFGDLFLEDIRAYRASRLHGTGITPLFPIFGTRALSPRRAREMIDSGLRARIVTCDPRQLDASFAGRLWDADLLADLPDGVDPCGENGEFHTFVFDSPDFAAPIAHDLGAIVDRDGVIHADVTLTAP
ncbi:Dph6-related ATP pyrophosphatase [Roseivivax sp. CAU 1753]